VTDASAIDPVALFDAYLSVTGVASLEHARADDPSLQGRTLGIINGSSWISLWSTWFARLLVPGVKLVSAGSEAVQLSFMAAHRRGEAVPPQANIELFARTAVDLVRLHPVDAILITCSTMNRAHPAVRDAVRVAAAPREVPVVQIDEPMMEKAVRTGPRILAVATHGPTVENTKALLLETAERAARKVSVECATVERAFDLLGEGDVRGHNDEVASVIRRETGRGRFDAVVLAQLSMSAFVFSYPDRIAAFGLPVLTSGEEGFLKVREVLRQLPRLTSAFKT
jgi:hypothetical protein